MLQRSSNTSRAVFEEPNYTRSRIGEAPIPRGIVAAPTHVLTAVSKRATLARLDADHLREPRRLELQAARPVRPTLLGEIWWLDPRFPSFCPFSTESASFARR